jgi:hypothetical protein
MSMPSRSAREHAGKPAASDEHTSRQQSPASDPSQSAESSRDMPIGAAGIDFQPPPSQVPKLPRSSPTRQVVTAKVTSPENSERRRRTDAEQRQQHRQQQPSSRPPAAWSIHEGQGPQQHAQQQQQQYPPYQAGTMPFSVPRAQQQVRYRLVTLCDSLGSASRLPGSISTCQELV